MTEKRLYRRLYYIVRPALGIYYPLKIYGRENIPEGGALICANHSSDIDPVFVGLALGRNHCMKIMAKESLFHIPILGRLITALGAFPVRRGTSDLQAVKFAMEQLRAGEYVLMFPEGTRIKSREEGKPKTGAAMLACRTGVPVLPMYVPMHKRVLRINRVYIGTPYYMKTSGKHVSNQEYEALIQDLMDRIYNCGDGV